MTGTLNDMTPDALRDLAKRAEATAVQKEKDAAAKKAEEDANAVVKVGGYTLRLRDGVITGSFSPLYCELTGILMNTQYNKADIRCMIAILKDAEQYKNTSSGAVRGLSKDGR